MRILDSMHCNIIKHSGVRISSFVKLKNLLLLAEGFSYFVKKVFIFWNYLAALWQVQQVNY